MPAPSADELKRQAAAMALEAVAPGMRLGLGTGSTAAHFVDLLGARVKPGLEVVGVPTSERTRAQAAALGVPLATLEEAPELDLTVDGADEIDPQLNLIKGGGGALLREKIVAAASDRMIVIADDSKWVERLGRFPLPIEVVPFGIAATRRAIAEVLTAHGLAGRLELRTVRTGPNHGLGFVTDGSHWIIDAHLGAIPDAAALAASLAAIPGVVEHGLFIGLASAAVLAGSNGIRVIERPRAAI
jgi:ribose 5-phosphate isomerase A